MKNRLKDLLALRFNSPLARKLLSFYYKPGKFYSIPFGPNRGASMHYDRTVNYHAILGLMEIDNLKFFKRILVDNKRFTQQRAPVAADVGANIGTVSIWLQRQLSKEATVYAFEPSPDSIERLSLNLERNKCHKVEKVQMACSNEIGTAQFHLGWHHHKSSLHESWAGEGRTIEVDTTTMDAFFQHKQRDPDFVKIDIEGGATFALPGMSRIAQESRPLLFIELHTPSEDRAASDFAIEHNYSAYSVDTNRWIPHLDRIYPDPEGIQGNMFLCPAEEEDYYRNLLQN